MELKNINEDRNIIEEVCKDSIAEEIGLVRGDTLISINDTTVKDIIDYKYLISDNIINISIEKQDGEIWDIEIEKEYDEDIGILFSNSLIDKAKSCKNKCIFCFIDQLPPNMRDTLYFKDDDSRLSFLQGNFITLTNMSDEEIDRIIEYRLSPINISVHTTNPELRVTMLNNKNAGKLYDILKRFHEVGLVVNCQIVLVQDVNDKDELKRTLDDLSKLHPTVRSVAVVPIGITKYRENLKQVKKFDEVMSNEVLDFIQEKQIEYLKRFKSRFVFASDEFYAITSRTLPSTVEYEGFLQIENGVGLMKSFEDEIKEELKKIKGEIVLEKNIIIATGTLAKNFMEKIANIIVEKFQGLEIKVVPIINDFFGDTITVSGLVTGCDLINQLEEFEDIDFIIIPRTMMKSDEEVFLDNMGIEHIRRILNPKVMISKVNGYELVNKIRNLRWCIWKEQYFVS